MGRYSVNESSPPRPLDITRAIITPALHLNSRPPVGLSMHHLDSAVDGKANYAEFAEALGH